MTPPTPHTVARAITVAKHHFRYPNEDALQQQLYTLLRGAFDSAEVRREVILEGDLGRVDVMVDRVAVEVKVASRPREVRAQLERYASSSQIDGLVLVTSRVDHGSGSGAILGKPAVIVSLVGAAL